MCRRNWWAPPGGQHLPSLALGIWPTVAGRLPGYSCGGGFEFSHCPPQNLDGRALGVWSSSGVPLEFLHPGATCPGHGAEGWANHVRGVVAEMETVPAGWCGETSIAWPAWPRRGKVADSLEPVRRSEPLAALGSPRHHLSSPRQAIPIVGRQDLGNF